MIQKVIKTVTRVSLVAHRPVCVWHCHWSSIHSHTLLFNLYLMNLAHGLAWKTSKALVCNLFQDKGSFPILMCSSLRWNLSFRLAWLPGILWPWKELQVGETLMEAYFMFVFQLCIHHGLNWQIVVLCIRQAIHGPNVFYQRITISYHRLWSTTTYFTLIPGLFPCTVKEKELTNLSLNNMTTLHCTFLMSGKWWEFPDNLGLRKH